METPELLIELGAVLVGLAILARVAARLSLPTIPLYLLVGLAFGEGGLLPLNITKEFITIGAEIGLILLLFTLGLEYSARELVESLRTTVRPAILDLVFNFIPGLIAGFLFGWGYIPALFLGGITYVSSSGVAAKLMRDLPVEERPESGFVLSILIVEDLAMALYLPTVAALVIGGASLPGLAIAGLGVAAVIVVILVGMKLEVGISRLLFSRSDEALLLTIMGLAILVAGVAEAVEISAAVGALLVGILLSGPAAHAADSLLAPLRDLFAALFFAFVGLSVDASTLGSALFPAFVLAVVTGGSKFFSSWISAGWAGLSSGSRLRAGVLLMSRGEFSLVIAAVGVAAQVEPDLGPVAIAYVLMLVVLGPILARIVQRSGGSKKTIPIWRYS